MRARAKRQNYMARPSGIYIYDTFLTDEWTDFTYVVYFFARITRHLQKYVQKRKDMIKIHENQCHVAKM